jgi:hypothetical protein
LQFARNPTFFYFTECFLFFHFEIVYPSKCVKLFQEGTTATSEVLIATAEVVIGVVLVRREVAKVALATLNVPIAVVEVGSRMKSDDGGSAPNKFAPF